MPKTVIVLSGTAFGTTPEEETTKTRALAQRIVSILEEGNPVIICYGNGPQSGRISRVFELSREQGCTPAMPLADCTAMTEGYMGFNLQESLDQAMAEAGKVFPTAAILTQVVVDADDEAFSDPKRPIGAEFDEQKAQQLMKETGDVYKQMPNGKWRRVVPAPKPMDVREMPAIRYLLDQGTVVIAGGGGGIPVSRTNDGYAGVTADIDQVATGALLAELTDADTLLILTPEAALLAGQGTECDVELGTLTPDKARELLKQGEFGAGRFSEQIETAAAFVAGKNGRQAIICDPDEADRAFAGSAGTVIAASGANAGH